MIQSLFQLLLLLSFSVLFFFKERQAVRQYFFPVLYGLVFLGFAAHTHFFSFHGGVTHVHNLEMYHYYMGSKYFPETGYTKLYEASVIADSEDDPHFNPDLPLRSLKNYELVFRKSVLERRDEVLSSFTPDRWSAFKKDLAVFRSTAPTHWGTKFGYQDHGYNGTPLTTAFLSLISSQTWIQTGVFIKIAAALDLFLIFLTGAVLARILNGEAALLFLFFTALNPFNDYSMIGGAYFRYDYFLTLALSAACCRRGFFKAGGVFAALSGLFRIFPFFCAVTFAVNSIFNRRRVPFDRVSAFLLTFIMVCLGSVLLTSNLKNPEQQNPWRSFGQQIALHREQLNVNKVGMKYLFMFSDHHNIREVLKTWPDGERLNWAAESGKTFQKHKAFYAGLCFLTGGLLLFFLRRASGTEAFFGGVAAAFIGLLLSNYYYSFLSLIPLLFSESRKAVLLTAGIFGIMIFLPLIPVIGSVPDRRFFVLCTGLFVFMMLLLMKRRVEKGR